MDVDGKTFRYPRTDHVKVEVRVGSRYARAGRERRGTVRRIPSRYQRGLTLIELMTALALAAILLSLSVPSFEALVRKSRIAGDTNQFVAAVNLARSEAIKRQTLVVMCRSDNADTDTPTCDNTGDARVWNDGWLLYALPRGSAVRDYQSANDVLLRRSTGSRQGETLEYNKIDSQGYLVFHFDGTLDEGGNAVYAICDNNKEKTGKLITITMTGRPEVSSTSSNPASNCDFD